MADHRSKIIAWVVVFTVAVPALAGSTEPPPAARATPAARKPAHPHPRTADREDQRRNMVNRQVAARRVRDVRVLEAMRNVPRHWFVPAPFTAMAYQDRPLSIGHGQTISQPYIVALMT